MAELSDLAEKIADGVVVDLDNCSDNDLSGICKYITGAKQIGQLRAVRVHSAVHSAQTGTSVSLWYNLARLGLEAELYEQVLDIAQNLMSSGQTFWAVSIARRSMRRE